LIAARTLGRRLVEPASVLYGRSMRTIVGVAAAVFAVAQLGATADAAVVTVKPGESIQAAVDAAPSGSTIMVMPGTYHEPGTTHAVTVTRDDIKLVARSKPGRAVILEASGAQTDGIWVSPIDTVDTDEDERPPCGTSGTHVRNFRVSGFTVRGFSRFGVYLACVTGFRISDVVSADNGEYAIFPVASQHGRLTRSQGMRTRSDACLYIGEDDSVVVDHSLASDCQIGFEIENSRHVVLRDNVSRGNTAGIIVDVINDRLTTTCTDNVVEHNVFDTNNRPSSALPSDDTSDLQPGIGIIIAGADRTTVRKNTVTGNSLAGMTLVDFCLDRADVCAMPGLEIDPRPDGNRVIGNTFEGNGTPVVFLPNGGQDNCFAKNRPALPNVPDCHARKS
jgi:nitrous oxidase accessory protein NosD